MDSVLELLKYTVPALVVFVAAFLIMKKFMDNEYRKQMLELRKANQKIATPLRLQAYERLTLFVERVALNNLVARVHKQGMSAKLLQAELVRTIRMEYEHNLTQQVYVSGNVWQTVKLVKEEIIKIINLSAAQMPDNASGAQLSTHIFETLMKLETPPTNIASDQIKKEIRQLF